MYLFLILNYYSPKAILFNSQLLSMVFLDVRHRYEHSRQHRKYHCLDVAHQHLEQHHEYAQQHTDRSHRRTSNMTHNAAKGKHYEDDARQ